MRSLLYPSILCVATSLFPLHQQASPLLSIGDNADLFFNGSTSIRSTSNLFRDESDEVDELIYIVSPGFELNIGRGQSNADFGITTRYDILTYSDEDNLDTETFHIKAFGSYRASRLDLSGEASFDQRQSTTGDESSTANLDDLIESDNTRLKLDSEYRFSPKFSFGSGVSYTETEYTSFEDRFADREKVSVPLDLYYELTPKVDLSFGYAYANTEVEERAAPAFGTPGARFTGEYERDSHFFNVGARGNLLPKLNGFFKVGYRVQDLDNSATGIYNLGGILVPGPDTDRDDGGILGVDADLTWTATPKLTLLSGFSRDFGVDGEGNSSEDTAFNVNANYALNTQFSASANARYTIREYTGNREDEDVYGLGARLSYKPNQFWRISGGLTYSELSSDDAQREFEDVTFDLTASLRY